MAKKVANILKLQIPAGGANPSPPVGPALGQVGVNIMDFCNAFNSETQNAEKGLPLPVVITVYEDKSFTFVVKTPPAAVLIKKALGIPKGSGEPNREKVGKLSRAQLEDIAKQKEPDLNSNDIDAALIGENYLKKNNKFKIIKTINACEFSKDDIPNIEKKAKILTIFLSQSGETSDVYNCLKICKAQGTITMGIINKVDSLIAREVMCGIYLNAGSEISVASTKSFTSMLVVLSLLEMWFTNNYLINNEKINSLRILSSTINHLFYNINFLKYIDNIKDFIIENEIKNIFILGKNNLFPVACEGSLKIKEVTYLHCEGFSAGSLKHGPFALLDKSNLTLLLIDYNDSNNYQNLKSTYYEILGRETNLIVITNSEKVINELNLKENSYCLLYKLDFYNEIIFTIALQKLAYELSIGKGINPDKPRNLAKVVTVE